MALIFSNKYLSVEQMKGNALYIWTKLKEAGWTENAIAGVLGNMQSESTINPGLFENRDYGNMDGGYGLVQWTPASKYFNWAGTTPANDNIDKQIDRILYEVEHNIQWLNSQDPKGRTFKQFTQSTDSPYDLAMAFITAYERPANPNQPIRGQQALYWFNELSGQSWEGGGPWEPGEWYIEYILFSRRFLPRRR